MEEELEFLRKENERLHRELDVALDKAIKYDILIDTMFNTLVNKIGRSLYEVE